jgi:osmoprotectant transport system substrate-binding protein
MKRLQRIGVVLVVLLAISVLFGACAKKSAAAVRVGSKNFTENLVLAELYALTLEDAGVKVDRRFDLASSVVHAALVNNEIDLYPEYTGTGLLAVLKLPLITDPQEVYDTVKAEYAKQFDVVWLDYAEANDGQGIVITKKASDAYGIRTISDLQRNAQNIRFASQGEFDEREDGIPGLTKVYGPFPWASSTVYSDALKYQVLGADEADAAPAYTTEGTLVDPAYVLLEDDRYVWPPYNIAPVVRRAVLDQYPQIANALNAVNAKIDTPTITRLNALVDLDKQEYADVAKDFYNLIK